MPTEHVERAARRPGARRLKKQLDAARRRLDAAKVGLIEALGRVALAEKNLKEVRARKVIKEVRPVVKDSLGRERFVSAECEECGYCGKFISPLGGGKPRHLEGTPPICSTCRAGQCLSMRRAGRTLREIGKAFGISGSQVGLILRWNEWRKTR